MIGLNMRKNSQTELTLVILVTALCVEAKPEFTVYYPAKMLKWDDARQYCKKNHIDLVTLDMADLDKLMDWLVKNDLFPVWVGLHEDPEQQLVWKWINVKTGEGVTGEDVSQTTNWANTENITGSCGLYSIHKLYYKVNCSEMHNFLCTDDDLVLVTENKTWEDALSHCRNMTTSSYQYDLLSFTDSSDFSYVRDRIYRATTEEVWTGLRFLGGEWWWSDGETLDPQEMLPDCPSRWKHCGTVSKNNTDNWITRDCSEKRNFICSRQDVFLTNDVGDNV
ncbi:uncharacterized protein LOC108232267 [Kryptolebias marmoratus]|uniref:uncharacterized protein LOC108232267 n=1 Tax=Kryptolebias marmoratus TaxID=37003 RepID=UPI0007F8CD06|nr:uncharacterized protein LOC108232267 [Kryptolebias marmoratus]